jgi:HAE1 family hydrophobic/amphiphilic exporter-1
MLGTTVIGGMLTATCIAIFLIPVTYTLFEQLSLRFSKKHEDGPMVQEKKAEEV